ncbi:Glycosyltransferase involved in cell wall bisynthesis [Dyadobacter soli]|uniref:Glycosyltransferase involved in cell wall bisynthesis n=2 Tax=Dyadobacter soli TaxID=659014 RepID=A0A1G6XK00_9BACT|nr:Glycosyltransferase involved in cell wall bisynthesis [Dyadobacter soli]
MKVVFINTSDSSGGAAIACLRLQKALEKHLGIQGTILVQEKKMQNPAVISLSPTPLKKKLAWLRFVAERLLFLPYEKSKDIRFLFNRGMVGIDISSHPAVQNADIIHLHWITFGFLSTHSLKKLFALGKPIVWTFHDMWPFTGGCHHSGDCDHYRQQCGNCKFVKKPGINDISKMNWLAKRAAYGLLFSVGCSNWIARKASESSLMAGCYIDSIPNPIDINIFTPLPKCQAKLQLNIPIDKHYILFASMRINALKKGFSYFEEALHIFKSSNKRAFDNIEIIVFGSGDYQVLNHLPFPVHNLGHLVSESQINAAYSAASVFVTPSLEENLPNTIMESLACGTPVVGFKVGGIPEMIEHKVNGYLSDYACPESLAEGISWILKNNSDGQLSHHARQKVLECYSEEVVAAKYGSIYNHILAKR